MKLSCKGILILKRKCWITSNFNNLFPIESFSKNARLEFVSYRLEEPEFSERECQLRGLSYAATEVRQLITYDKNTDKETVKKVKISSKLVTPLMFILVKYP